MIELNYDKKWKNTNKFRKEAIHFQKYGYYTAAPKGTSEYKKYWDEQRKRSLFGFTSEDGDYITGYHYFYLNFCVILVAKDKVVIGSTGKKKTQKVKEIEFPDFWDSDKQYFDIVQEAEEQGKHLVVLKARRKGYSYKSASMLIRNYFLIPKSVNAALAAENEFLIKDGLLTKAWDMMDFIDEHTAFTKKRQKTDTKMHRRSSMVVDKEGTKIEIGYKSEIIGMTLKNDAQKIRGKSYKLAFFEEAGKFRDLLTAWQIAQSSATGDGGTTGMLIAFGTGGEEDAEYEGLKELFYSPEAYNILPIRNIWDTGADNSACGFFVPAYVNIGREYMDEDGNTLLHKSKEKILNDRKIVEEKASSKNAIDRHIAELPITPMEATLQLYGNIFPKKELAQQLAKLQTNQAIKNYKQVGELLFDNKGELKWVQTTGSRDIVKYPLGNADDKTGSIVIWEHPVPNPPYGLYIAGSDTYDHDDSGTGSLGSTFIYKRFQDFESYYDIIVAEYTGRPETAEEYYENVRKLLLYYNATLLYENERKGIFPYFATKNSEYLLADQPDIITDIVKDSKVKRRKGIHMVQSIKDWGEREIRDWLNEEVSPGVKQLTRIMSIPLLQELIAYNDKGNFDRVMALMMVMIYKKELHKVKVKENTYSKSDPFFSGPIFSIDKTLNYNLRKK